jgi:hypothetical protein
MGLFQTFYEAEAVGEKSEGIIPSMATGPPLKGPVLSGLSRHCLPLWLQSHDVMKLLSPPESKDVAWNGVPSKVGRKMYKRV